MTPKRLKELREIARDARGQDTALGAHLVEALDAYEEQAALKEGLREASRLMVRELRAQVRGVAPRDPSAQPAGE